MKCPYRVLGLKKRASDEEVKARYRELAKRHHPDRNIGYAKAEQRFKEVQEAYDVLGDPEKRKRYDETGETDGGKADNEQSQTFAIINDILIKIIIDATEKGCKPGDLDLSASLIQSVQDSIEHMKKERAKTDRILAALEAVVERSAMEDGTENLVALAAKGRIVETMRVAENIDREVEKLGRALKFAKKYRYRMDLITPWVSVGGTASATAGTWHFKFGG